MSHTATINKLNKAFYAHYSHLPIHIFFAPGRVNLIGEHTDYTKGKVMPCSLSEGTYLAMRPIKQRVLQLTSLNFPDQSYEFSLSQELSPQKGAWTNYPLGVIQELHKAGISTGGWQCMYYGDIPTGAGLSSSASINILTVFAWSTCLDLNWDRWKMVHIAQAAEQNFAGVNCGILDPFAIAFARDQAATYLDCHSLVYESINLELPEHEWWIVNSNRQRTLADSKYNERYDTCIQILEKLNLHKSCTHLGGLLPKDWIWIAPILSTPIHQKRLRHIITENQRVSDFAQALKDKNPKILGQLMWASHQSLKRDYEVTGQYLDALVDIARGIDGVVGARMTGAGFGGCSIHLVRKNAVAEFKETLATNYYKHTQLEASFYPLRDNHALESIVFNNI
ncbi:MAG: galactokinase [Saprospiraceae bacterium]|nr:galactokinase [Saprospiraceae bacterium]